MQNKYKSYFSQKSNIISIIISNSHNIVMFIDKEPFAWYNYSYLIYL